MVHSFVLSHFGIFKNSFLSSAFSTGRPRYGAFGPQIPVLFSYGPQITKFCRAPYQPVHGSLDYTATSVYYHRAESAVWYAVLSVWIFQPYCWLALATRWCILFKITSSDTFVTPLNVPEMNQHHFEITKPHLCQAAQYVIIGQPQKCHSKILILQTKAPKWPKMTENDQMMLP